MAENDTDRESIYSAKFVHKNLGNKHTRAGNPLNDKCQQSYQRVSVLYLYCKNRVARCESCGLWLAGCGINFLIVLS